MWSQFCSWENTLQIHWMQRHLKIKCDMEYSKKVGAWRDIKVLFSKLEKVGEKTMHGYEDQSGEKSS
mgnify:CR=1 FL=1